MFYRFRNWLEYQYNTKVKGMRLYWVSAYTMWGNQFGCTLWAHNEKELWQNFEENYPDSDVADWGIW